MFQGCTALQRLDLGKEGRGPTYLNRSLPDCCFLEAGIVALYLPSDFNRIGTAACVSCQQPQTVDLSQTRVNELWAQLSRTAHSYNNSVFPKIYESLSKKPFPNVPRCKKSASHHPYFTSQGFHHFSTSYRPMLPFWWLCFSCSTLRETQSLLLFRLEVE